MWVVRQVRFLKISLSLVASYTIPPVGRSSVVNRFIQGQVASTAGSCTTNFNIPLVPDILFVK